MKTLVDSERVSWVGRLGGDFQYGVSVCARNIKEVSNFFDNLSSEYGNIFFEKSIAILVSLTHFRMKYLSKKKALADYITISETGARTEIDNTDHKILEGLAHSTYSSRRDLAQKLGLPASTLDYRIRKLQDAKIIEGFTYLARTSQLGIQMYLLLLYVKAINQKLKTRLFNFCLKHPNVNFVIEYMGAWDYEVGVEVEDSRDITVIVEEFYSEFSDVLNTIRVFQVFDYPKVSKYPFRSFSLVE